jgi:SAM-dependent methyltransferase
MSRSGRVGDGAPEPPEVVPATVARRVIELEQRPPDGDERAFDTEDARAINRARLEHLASLGLPLEGRSVLDVGGGPGHLAQFFVERHCRIVSTDARAENVARARELYPQLDAHILDVEDTEAVRAFGRFDVVFCYGLLYHLENPLLALRNLVGACDDVLLVETMICDSDRPVVLLDDETASWNQALRGLGCRPSPSWIAMALDRAGMHHVYAPTTKPDFPDYLFAWRNDLAWSRDGRPLRCTFLCSRDPIENERLIPLVV